MDFNCFKKVAQGIAKDKDVVKLKAKNLKPRDREGERERKKREKRTHQESAY